MTTMTFPVTYSTLACDALARQVLTQYPIEHVTDCQLWNRGLSDVYLVQTGTTPYILRVTHAHWRNQAEVEFELELLDFLRSHHVPVAYPLRTWDGHLSIPLDAPEGRRYAALFTYAPGTIALGDLNDAQSYTLGETVAHMHSVAAQFHCPSPKGHRAPLTPENLLDGSLKEIAPFLRHRPDDLSYLQHTVAEIKQKVAHLPQEAPYWVICWGDPHSGNAHFTEENQITLFDFGQCGYGWRAFEFGKFLQTSIRTGMRRSTRDAFLKGYQAVQPVYDEELHTLQAFTQMAHIWSWWIYLNSTKLHNYSQLDDRFFSQRLQQLKMLKTQQWQLF